MSKQNEFNYYNDATRYSTSEFKPCIDCSDPEACKLAMGCALEEYEEEELDDDELDKDENATYYDGDELTQIKEPPSD